MHSIFRSSSVLLICNGFCCACACVDVELAFGMVCETYSALFLNRENNIYFNAAYTKMVNTNKCNHNYWNETHTANTHIHANATQKAPKWMWDCYSVSPSIFIFSCLWKYKIRGFFFCSYSFVCLMVWCGSGRIFSFYRLNCDFRTVPFHTIAMVCACVCAFVVELRFSNIHFFTTTAAHTLVDIENKKKRVDVCVCVASLRVYN